MTQEEDEKVGGNSYLIKLVDIIGQEINNLPCGCLAHRRGTKAQRLKEKNPKRLFKIL